MKLSFEKVKSITTSTEVSQLLKKLNILKSNTDTKATNAIRILIGNFIRKIIARHKGDYSISSSDLVCKRLDLLLYMDWIIDFNEYSFFKKI